MALKFRISLLQSRANAFLLFVLLFVSTVLYALVQQSSLAQKPDFFNLTLRISSTKEVFAELEPIPIILNLRNESNEKVIGHSALEFSDNFVKLFIIEEGGEAGEIQDVSPITAHTVAAPREMWPVWKRNRYPQLRARYEAAIQTNKQRIEAFNRQQLLKKLEEEFRKNLRTFAVAAYSKPPVDQAELMWYLNTYIADDQLRQGILDEVQLNQARK